MIRLPRVTGREALRALQRGGFVVIHVRGSHHNLRKPAALNLVVVPVHAARNLPTGTIRAILRQARLTPEEFLALHRG